MLAGPEGRLILPHLIVAYHRDCISRHWCAIPAPTGPDSDRLGRTTSARIPRIDHTSRYIIRMRTWIFRQSESEVTASKSVAMAIHRNGPGGITNATITAITPCSDHSVCLATEAQKDTESKGSESQRLKPFTQGQNSNSNARVWYSHRFVMVRHR